MASGTSTCRPSMPRNTSWAMGELATPAFRSSVACVTSVNIGDRAVVVRRGCMPVWYTECLSLVRQTQRRSDVARASSAYASTEPSLRSQH